MHFIINHKYDVNNAWYQLTCRWSFSKLIVKANDGSGHRRVRADWRASRYFQLKRKNPISINFNHWFCISFKVLYHILLFESFSIQLKYLSKLLISINKPINKCCTAYELLAAEKSWTQRYLRYFIGLTYLILYVIDTLLDTLRNRYFTWYLT